MQQTSDAVWFIAKLSFDQIRTAFVLLRCVNSVRMQRKSLKDLWRKTKQTAAEHTACHCVQFRTVGLRVSCTNCSLWTFHFTFRDTFNSPQSPHYSQNPNKGVLKKLIQRGCWTKGLRGGFGSLEVACWVLVPKFAGSNQAEAVGFFRAK